jgi:hypothetical protein
VGEVAGRVGVEVAGKPTLALSTAATARTSVVAPMRGHPGESAPCSGRFQVAKGALRYLNLDGQQPPPRCTMCWGTQHRAALAHRGPATTDTLTECGRRWAVASVVPLFATGGHPLAAPETSKNTAPTPCRGWGSAPVLPTRSTRSRRKSITADRTRNAENPSGQPKRLKRRGSLRCGAKGTRTPDPLTARRTDHGPDLRR